MIETVPTLAPAQRAMLMNALKRDNGPRPNDYLWSMLLDDGSVIWHVNGQNVDDAARRLLMIWDTIDAMPLVPVAGRLSRQRKAQRGDWQSVTAGVTTAPATGGAHERS